MKIFQSISSITSIIIILMMIVILTMTLKVIIENGNRLTSSCRFPPLLQLPTAAQLSYSHQMIVIITKLVAVMMIINHWAHLVSKAYSKDWFRIRRSQKLFHLGHRRGTSLSMWKDEPPEKVKEQDVNNFKDYWQKMRELPPEGYLVQRCRIIHQ